MPSCAGSRMPAPALPTLCSACTTSSKSPRRLQQRASVESTVARWLTHHFPRGHRRALETVEIADPAQTRFPLAVPPKRYRTIRHPCKPRCPALTNASTEKCVSSGLSPNRLQGDQHQKLECPRHGLQFAPEPAIPQSKLPESMH